MSDDLREREPARNNAEDPPPEGLRNDHAGTSASLQSPAPPPASEGDGPASRPGHTPEGDDLDDMPMADRPDEFPEQEPPGEPTTQLNSAGGGYGSGSARASSGGSGEGQTPAGEDPQTDWLREEG
jgi:hypothetical protein